MGTPNPFFRRYREAHGLTQSELAKRLGVTQGAIGHIERGIRDVTAKKAKAWAAILDVTPAEIMFPEPEQKEEAAA